MKGIELSTEMTDELTYVAPMVHLDLHGRMVCTNCNNADNIRKETAKEILQSELDNMKQLTGCGVPYHFKKFIQELADQYGVEIDE